MLSTKTLGTSTAVALNVIYDNAYRSTTYDWKKSGNTVIGFTYGYSNAGNKKYEEKLHDTDKSQLYLYDGVYRLTKFKEGTLNEAKTDIASPTYYQDWEHDGLGNWTKFYDNSGTPETRTHNAVNELTARDATNLTYDDNGNLTDDGTYTYAYDALNRLIKVLKKGSPDITVGEYAYDALNRRIWREADEDNDSDTDVDLMYFYDTWRVVEERDYSDEGLLRDYIYGNYIDEPIFGRSDNNDNGDFGGSEEQFYYTHNNIYNVVSLLDTSGDIIETYEYKPYGKVAIYTDDGADFTWFTSDDVTGSLSENYYLFTGRRYDPESQLYYFRARMYSPGLGRFTSRDPFSQRMLLAGSLSGIDFRKNSVLRGIYDVALLTSILAAFLWLVQCLTGVRTTYPRRLSFITSLILAHLGLCLIVLWGQVVFPLGIDVGVVEASELLGKQNVVSASAPQWLNSSGNVAAGFGDLQPGGRYGAAGGMYLLDALNHYTYVSNNPVNFMDPTGEVPWGYIVAVLVGILIVVLAHNISKDVANYANCQTIRSHIASTGKEYGVIPGQPYGRVASNLLLEILTTIISIPPGVSYTATGEGYLQYRAVCEDGKRKIYWTQWSRARVTGTKDGVKVTQIKTKEIGSGSCGGE